MKTCPFITERLLIGRKESNQTNKIYLLDRVMHCFTDEHHSINNHRVICGCCLKSENKINNSHLSKPKQTVTFNKYGPRRKKTCLRGFANNKGADQPAHLRRLVSAFVIYFLESTISKHASS